MNNGIKVNSFDKNEKEINGFHEKVCKNMVYTKNIIKPKVFHKKCYKKLTFS